VLPSSAAFDMASAVTGDSLIVPHLFFPGDNMIRTAAVYRAARCFLWNSLARVAACVVCLAATVTSADALDWPHWRGPNMNGVSPETDLPEKWSAKGENLLWRKHEYATRSTPVVMDGRVYVVCRAFPETTQEGEKTVCLDAATGDLIWESVHNVYLSDAPAERVGWSSVVGDPAGGRVYVLGLGCLFQCLDAKTGRIVWEHSMSEEYGMLSTYGGRTNFPVVFEDLVVISGVMTGWGETAIPAHRFVAFDKATGSAVWLKSTKLRPEDTTYSTPVVATLNGQPALVVGAGDGAIYAIQPRTGRTIWKYQASTRGLNTTPLVDNGIVYCGHSEQNQTDTTILGAVFAFNGNTEGEISEGDLLWKIPKRTVGRSAPLKLGDRVYFVEDGATLVIVEAATGKLVGTKKLGRIMFGSLAAGAGRIYVAENTGRCYVLKPTDKGVDVASETRLPQGEEVFGSPVIANGRIYIPSIEALYCIGSSAAKSAAAPLKSAASARVASVSDRTVAQLLLTPVESLIRPGEKVQFEVRGYNAAGQFVELVKNATVTVQGGGVVGRDLVYTAPAGITGVTLTAAVGTMTATARTPRCSTAAMEV
jgi:outer membrane protein assembly factor BamB